MIIDLTQLEKDELHIEHKYLADEINLEDSEHSLISPCEVSIDLRRRGREIDLRGKLQTQVSATCDRCLADVKIDVKNEFKLVCLPIDKLSQTDELILERHELDFSSYQDEKIDIDDLIRVQVQLAIPMSNLCRKNCKGLCSQCGEDRNLVDCKCDQQDSDLRWQALADLKKKY
jgi:uncharacterized protein